MSSIHDDKDKIIKALREEISQLKGVINSVPGSIYWKNLKLKYLGRNKYALEKSINVGLEDSNADQDAILGKTDYDIFSHHIADQYHENDLEVIQHGKEISREEVFSLNNSVRLVQLSQKRLLRDEAGHIIGVVGNTVDITDRKKMEEALRKPILSNKNSLPI